MKQLIRLVLSCLACSFFAAAAAAAPPTYFGYTNGDMSKVGSYTNVVYYAASPSLPSGLYDTYLAQYNWQHYQVKTMLDFTGFLYTGDGASYKPIAQANAAFDAWLTREWSYFSPTYVLGLYPGDEALTRCMHPGQYGFQTVSACMAPYFQFVSHIQSQLNQNGKDVPLGALFTGCDFNPPAANCNPATVPLLTPTLAQAFLAAGIDWVGHDRYGVKLPYNGTDADAALMRADIDTLKSLFPGHPWFLVGDAFHNDCYHSGWTAADHVTVADQDFRLACSKGAIMIMNFNWTSWDECGRSHGSNEFGPGGFFGTQDVLCYHRCIGRRIKYGETTCGQCGLGLWVNCS